MKMPTKLLAMLSVLILTGCASTFPWMNGGAPAKDHLRFKTFDYAGTSVLYRDLSSPCDTSSVSWNKNILNARAKRSEPEQTIDCSLASNQKRNSVEQQQWKIEEVLSISFAMREKALASDSNQSDFSKLRDYLIGTTKFQIYGAAGFEGERAERLGLARAKYVRGRLMEMGVGDERISIMPYDPTIPGLQAVIKIHGAVVL